jgi:uncharacterized protein (TIGR02145 family)
MKKILQLSVTVLIFSNLYAQDINITKGWQLLGAIEDINISKFNNSCADYLWKYDNNGWQVYATKSSFNLPASITAMTSLNKADGYWINASSECNLDTKIGSDSSNSSSSTQITFNGKIYKTVISPYTGKEWLDRNLGADQVCTAYDDSSCYGDYYQWGRNSDGHEKSSSNTTTTQATNTSNVGHGDFILDQNLDYDGDWAKDADSDGAIRSANWNPCPTGYRVPTIDELRAETVDQEVQTNADAYENFLKLPSAGYRNYVTGSVYNQSSSESMYGQNIYGTMWSSSVFGSSSKYLYFYSSFADSTIDYRADGLSVRCVKAD